MSDNLVNMNPLDGVFNEFKKIIDTIIIKYSYQAEAAETFESKRSADGYISAVNKKDTFFSYRNYSVPEIIAAGITTLTDVYKYAEEGGYLLIPTEYRETLLKNRRQKIIDEYVELNEYYRKLHGLPPLDVPSKYYHYLPYKYVSKYGIDASIPLHEIRDYYNKEETGKGDYIIAGIDGAGYIDELIEKYPSQEYLKFISGRRIPIESARLAKNFQILYISQSTVKDNLYDEFISCYEQCRDYFVSTLFMRSFRSFIEYYDNFIAMCIMIMTIQKTLNQQFPLGIDREFYNDYTLKMLYEAYNVPYDLDIDQITQRRITQNLNLLIQKKSTDKVIYDIADLLGYDNLNVYKYYLGKQRKFESGAPIIKYTQQFNTTTGEYETVPDYKSMYDVYFQKVEVRETDFIRSFNEQVNKENYDKVTSEDPFWWEDTYLYKQVWETEYNFVESKYLSLAVSYKMSEILYENTILLKMLMDKQYEISSIKIKLPKISDYLEVSIFDAIILLFCLTCKSHSLRGEIITIPTQVLDVLSYMKDINSSDEYLVDAFAFDFNLFKPENTEGQELINKVKLVLGNESDKEAAKFVKLIETLSIEPSLPNYRKIELINEIFTNIKGLDKFIQYKLSETQDRYTYEVLKEFHRAAFYSKEIKDIFTINYGTENVRTAYTFFEFLYDSNPKLYSILFTPNFEGQYQEYLENHDYIEFETYKEMVQAGDIPDFSYSTLNTDNKQIAVREELIYFYVDHIIARLKMYVNNLKFINKINNTASSLDKLLVRLILFFKSFTVDIIGLDTIYIMDMKVDNIFRFFDEPNKLEKYIDPSDDLNFSYSDTAQSIESNSIWKDKSMHLNDKIFIKKQD